MTAWYSVNTLSVQNNSPVATGTGTNFSDFVYPAFGIVIEGVPYEIISIDSATQLTLSKPYRGATKADAEYAIWPTQGLNYELWREATELVDLFGPLTNDMEVLNQQIADTLAAKNAAAVSATNSANSAADSLTRANAAQVSANASAVSATTAAGYATTADNHRLAAAASEANAAASASAANTSKLASASSAADALSLKNATTDLRDETVVAKNDAQTAKTAAENARDAAETAQGLSEAARDASVAAKNASETAKAGSETARDAAVTAKLAAETAKGASETARDAAGVHKDGAETAMDAAVNARDNAIAAKNAAETAQTGSQTARTGSEAAKDAAIVAKNAAEAAQLAAEAAAEEAQVVVTPQSIEDALGDMPALLNADNVMMGSNRVANLTFLTEDGPFLYHDSNNESFNIRVGPTGSEQYFSFHPNGVLQVNGSTYYHQNNKPTKADVGLGNVDNTSDANKPISTATQTALNGKQASLGFTPVQQGTGVGQGTNIVKIGWSGTRLKATVDSTDQGNFVFENSLISGLALKADLAGATFTGAISVPSDFTVRAQDGNTEGAQIVMKKAPNQGINGDIVIDTQGNGVRIFDNVTTARMLYFDVVNGQLQINGNYVFHDGRLPSKANVGLGNVDNTSDVNKPISTATQNALNGKLDKTGGTLTNNLTTTGSLLINNGSPTLYFQDTDHNSAMLHCNDNRLYVLRGGVNSTVWGQVNGRWPLEINLVNNQARFGGDIWVDQSGIDAWVAVSADAGRHKGIHFQKNGIARFDLTCNSEIESGTAAGSNLDLNVFNNSGAFITTAFRVYRDTGYTNFFSNVGMNGTLEISKAGATGGGIILADDGDIVDLNDGYCAMRFSSGVRIHSGNRTGGAAITLGSNGVLNAYEIYTGNWFRPTGGGGVYWEAYGRGIQNASTGATYGHINCYGSGLNGWAGYAIGNWAQFMANGSDCGIHSQQYGNWLVRWDSGGNAFFPQNITAYSDERIKQNMRPISDAAARRAGMAKAAIIYERDGETRVGFGAQTLEPSNPEVVKTANDLLGTKSVNYSDLVAVLAVDNQQQEERITALEAENARLRNLIAELENRMIKAGI